MSLVIYPGTFDPITLGHVNVAQRGLRIFDTVTIACTQGTEKNTMFSQSERTEMLKSIFSSEPRIEVDAFKGLLVDYMAKRSVTTILRGIRSVEDFEYEYQMTHANQALDSRVETVFMLTDGKFGHLSSSLIKEIAALGGNIDSMVPPEVLPWIREKFKAPKG